MNIDAATLIRKPSPDTPRPRSISALQTSAEHYSIQHRDAFVSGNVLQIILFGVLFGLALSQFREPRARLSIC